MSDNTPPCAGCGEYPGERIARLIQDQETTIRKQKAEIKRLKRYLWLVSGSPTLAAAYIHARAALKGLDNE